MLNELATMSNVHAPPALVALWSDLLGLEAEKIPPRAHFFELGGYSLLALRLVERIQEELGVGVDVERFFEEPTLERMAMLMGEPSASRPRSDENALDVNGHGGTVAGEPSSVLPLLPMQQAYWVGEQPFFEDHGPAFFYERIRVSELDPGRLKQALRTVIDTHQALRMIVQADGSQREQTTVPELEIPLEDLRFMEEEERLGRVRACYERMVTGLPAADEWPLIRMRAQRLPHGCVIHVTCRLAIMDGRSWPTFVRDLWRAYADGESPSKGGLDYAGAIRGLALRRNGPHYQKALDYWERCAPSLPGAPVLPRASQREETSRLSRRTRAISRESFLTLRARAARAGVTVNAVAASAFAYVLARYSEERHFCINVMFLNRPPIHPDFPRVVGNFSSTLLLELDLRERRPFVDQVRMVQQRLLRDLAHSDVSGVEVIRMRNRAQGMPHGAAPTMPFVFASVLDIDDGQEGAVLPPGAVIEHAEVQTPQVWLDHQLYERNGVLHVNWDVREQRFPEGITEVMFEAYLALLIELAEGDAAWQSERPVPLPASQRAMRERRNDTWGAVASERIEAGFLRRAAEQPEQIAVSHAGREISYGELERRSAAIAGRVAEHLGDSAEATVAIVMERGVAQVAAMLGVLRAGAAYVPLGPELPDDRLRRLLERSKSRAVVVASEAEADRLRSFDASRPVVCVEREATPRSQRWKDHPLSPSALAYVIYTSGSTGEPKGVAIEHRAAYNTLYDLRRRLELRPRDRVLALSAFSFDLSVFDVFALLGSGGRVIVPTQSLVRDPEHWAELLTTGGVTIWNTVPALMEMLVDWVGQRPVSFPSLRWVLLSGDWAPLHLPRRIKEICPNARILVLGGATEASIWSNYFEVQEVAPEWASIPYGFPLLNQQMRVLDVHGEDCPDWVQGELHIGGHGLARGYFGDATLTARQFIEPALGGERLYRTGDRARYWSDGTVEFLGRHDDQVKISGFRVELGEIQCALASHPGIKDAVVVATGGREQRRLLAYFTPSSRRSPTHDVLRQHLSSKLPHYMVPGRIECLSEMPLTANGKIDRGRLATTKSEGLVEGRREPATPLEARVHRIWSGILGEAGFGATDEFLSIGGDSIGAVRMAREIERQLGLKVPLGQLFELNTVEKLARHIEQGERSGGIRPMPVALGRIELHRPNVLCIHPIGGSVFAYGSLAAALSPHANVRAFEAAALNGGALDTSVDGLAEAYLRALDETGVGTDLIVGWSFGGIIAFAMAQRLGGAVPVVLIDPWVAADEGVPPDAAELEEEFLVTLTGETMDRGEVGRSPVPFSGDLAGRLRDRRARGWLGPDLDAQELSRLFAVYRGHTAALLRFAPAAAPQPRGLLMMAAHARSYGPRWLRPLDCAPAWATSSAALTVSRHPLDHFQIVRSAPILDAIVEDLLSRRRSPSARTSSNM